MTQSTRECVSAFFSSPPTNNQVKLKLGVGGLLMGTGIAIMVISTPTAIIVGAILLLIGCLLAMDGCGCFRTQTAAEQEDSSPNYQIQ